MTNTRPHLFEDGERVRIKATGEFVTVDHWWFENRGVKEAQYNILEYPATWFTERELMKKE